MKGPDISYVTRGSSERWQKPSFRGQYRGLTRPRGNNEEKTRHATGCAKFIRIRVKTLGYQRAGEEGRRWKVVEEAGSRPSEAQPGSLRSVFYDRIDYPRLCTWVSSPTNVCRTRAVSRPPLHGLSETARGFSYGPFLRLASSGSGGQHAAGGGGRRREEDRLNPSSTVHREFPNICRTWNRRSELDADKWLIFLSRRYTPPVAVPPSRTSISSCLSWAGSLMARPSRGTTRHDAARRSLPTPPTGFSSNKSPTLLPFSAGLVSR